MKKIVAGIVVILVLAGVGMPFISGLVIEKGVRKSVDEFNSLYGQTMPGVKIELLRYDRGFGSSEIEYRVDLGEIKGIYPFDDIIFIERAKHTYTGAVSETSLEKNSWYSKFIETYLGGKDPFHLVTEYTLLGEFRSVFTLDAFSAEIEGETLEARKGEFVFESDFSFKQMKASGWWQGAEVPGTLEVSGLSFASDLTMITTYLWDGEMSFGLEKMMAYDQEVDASLAGLKGKYLINYNQAANALDVDVVYGFGSMTSGTEYIDEASAQFGVKALDAVAYEEAMKLYVEMISSMLSEMAAQEGNPEQIAQAVEAKMMEIGLKMMGVYEKFLKSGLEIYVKDLRAKLPQGEIGGNFSVRLEQDLTMAQMFPMMNQPQLLFDYLSFKADFSMPAILGGGNPQLVSPFYPGMKTGLFIEEGDNLVHSSETREKQLYINGELLKLN